MYNFDVVTPTCSKISASKRRQTTCAYQPIMMSDDDSDSNDSDDHYSAVYHAKMSAKRHLKSTCPSITDAAEAATNTAAADDVGNHAAGMLPVSLHFADDDEDSNTEKLATAANGSGATFQQGAATGLQPPPVRQMFGIAQANTTSETVEESADVPDIENNNDDDDDDDNEPGSLLVPLPECAIPVPAPVRREKLAGAANGSGAMFQQGAATGLQPPPDRQMFGIAQANTTSETDDESADVFDIENNDDDDDDDDDDDNEPGSLLVPMPERAKPVPAPVRRGRKPLANGGGNSKKISKLRSLRTAFDKQFRSQLNKKATMAPAAVASTRLHRTAKQRRTDEKSRSGINDSRDDFYYNYGHRTKAQPTATAKSSTAAAVSAPSLAPAKESLTSSAAVSAASEAVATVVDDNATEPPVVVGIAERIKRSSRRKTVHQPIVAVVEFEDNTIPEPTTATAKQKTRPNPVTVTEHLQPELYEMSQLDEWIARQPETYRHHLEVVRRIRNPNADLMEKLAFLRTCINYMLRELGRPEIRFARGMTFEQLRKQYTR